jgi:hypothetical protein
VWVPVSRGLERDVLGGVDEPVWDTYLLYGSDAKWDGDRAAGPRVLDAPARAPTVCGSRATVNC